MAGHLRLPVQHLGIRPTDGQRPDREEEREQAEEAHPVVPSRDHPHVAPGRRQMAVRLLDEPLEHRHRRRVVRGLEQLARIHAVGEEGCRDVHPAAMPVLMQPSDHVDRLQREAELPPQRHHSRTVPSDARQPMGEQFRQQMAHPPGDFVHVVVEILFGPEFRAPLRPPRHSGARFPHAAHDDLARLRRQMVESFENARRIPGHGRVRRVFRGLSQTVDESRASGTSAEHAPPRFQQVDLFVPRDLLIVLQVVGNAQQQVGHRDLVPQRRREDLDADRERAARAHEKFVKRGHLAVRAPGQETVRLAAGSDLIRRSRLFAG